MGRPETLRKLLARKTDQFDEEGDEWLFRPNPDEASLAVDFLECAIEDEILGPLRAERDRYREALVAIADETVGHAGGYARRALLLDEIAAREGE